MAPRGIVAGATASAFGLQLAGAGIHGADKILPIVFVVVFGTVVVYGLTGMPVARWLGVAGAEGTLVLIVGGHEAARAVGAALRRAGVGVRLWASPSTHAAARSAGLDADRGRMLVDSLSRETELEEITDALLMSPNDDFNALAAAELRGDLGHGHVYRFAPDPDGPALLAPAAEVDILGRGELTLAELDRRLADGGRRAEDGRGHGRAGARTRRIPAVRHRLEGQPARGHRRRHTHGAPRRQGHRARHPQPSGMTFGTLPLARVAADPAWQGAITGGVVQRPKRAIGSSIISHGISEREYASASSSAAAPSDSIIGPWPTSRILGR